MVDLLQKKRFKAEKANLGFTLSDFYPAGSVYFYSFPAGDDSKFYNQVPTLTEELVSGRPLVCAGKDVKVVTFASCADDYTLGLLSQNLNLISRDNLIALPKKISAEVTGAKRNQMVKEALKDLLDDKTLVMAQPFLDDDLASKFKIKPELSVRLADKNNKDLYIPQKFLPKTYGTYENGIEFGFSGAVIPLPCVIKVASSSSGDGVRICFTEADVIEAKKTFRNVGSSILVEEYIDISHNLCVQFGISHNPSAKPVVIGFNEQVTGKQGEFFGGIVNSWKKIPYVENVYETLEEQILPRLRELGWYGIGGIDVLIRADGKFYFIDPNLRLTATYAYVYLAKTKQINQPLISFTGEITCTKKYFENQIQPLTMGTNPTLRIISLTLQAGVFRFNAGILFNSVADLKQKSTRLQELGVQSSVLTNIVHADFDYDIR